MPKTVKPRVGNRTATSRPSLSIACSCEIPSKFLLPASLYFSSKKSWRYLAKAGFSGLRGIGRILPSSSMPRSRNERLRPLGARSRYFLSMYRCQRSAGSKTCISESIALNPFLAICFSLHQFGSLALGQELQILADFGLDVQYFIDPSVDLFGGDVSDVQPQPVRLSEELRVFNCRFEAAAQDL